MLLMVRMITTCVVIRMAVPRMDLGVIQLTLKSDGNTATYLDVLQEVVSKLYMLNLGLRPFFTRHIAFLFNN